MNFKPSLGHFKTDVMCRSAKLTFMTGDKTDKATIEKLESALDNHRIDQFEILLYKKAGKCLRIFFCFRVCFFFAVWSTLYHTAEVLIVSSYNIL